MKRIIITVISIMALSVVGWVGIASAANVRSGTEVEVKSGETIEGPLYAAAEKLKIEGTVNGDVFCAGQMVEITGTVYGDVICAAQMIDLKGNVTGDVRIAAMQANFRGQVGGSATVGGQLVKFEKGSVLGRDLSLLAVDTTLAGTIGRDARVSSNSITVEGSVGRDLHVQNVESAKLRGEGRVNGNFVYTSNNEAEITDSASVGGTTQKRLPPAPEVKDEGNGLVAYITGAVFVFASMLLIGLAILLITPRIFDTTDASMRRRHIWAFGLGLVAIIFTPILAVILFFTLVGIPLSLIIMMLWGIGMIGAGIFAAYTIGSLISSRTQWNVRWPRLTNLALGLLAMFILGLIPFVNIIVMVCATIWGTGGLIIAAFEHLRRPRLEESVKKKV